MKIDYMCVLLASALISFQEIQKSLDFDSNSNNNNSTHLRLFCFQVYFH